MKKIYQTPEVEVEKVDLQDGLLTASVYGGNDTNIGWGGNASEQEGDLPVDAKEETFWDDDTPW